MLMWAARNRVGVNIGQRSVPSFTLTEHGRRMFSKQLGAPVLEDYLGITVFKAVPTPRFVRCEGKAVLRKSTEAFIEDVAASYGKRRFSSPKSEVATELYAASHFEASPSARFLALFVSLEALLAPLPRSKTAQEHIEMIIETTKVADIPSDEKQSLVGALAGLKNESIAQTARRIASKLLGNETYGGVPADQFFSKLYRVRNNFVHRGIVDQKELHVLVGEMDRFVSNILQHHFVEF